MFAVIMFQKDGLNNSGFGYHQDMGLISQTIYEFQIVQKIHIASMSKIDIQSCHNFAHATTAQLSWHVQNSDMIGWL